MSTIKTEITDHIGIIIFHNPPHNFMTADMVRDLDRITRNWEQDHDIRSIIITSDVAGVFISHYEIKDILRMFQPLQKTPRLLRGVNTAACLVAGCLIRILDKVQPIGSLFESALLKTPLSGVVELECIHRTFNRIQSMNKVVIAAINGEAMGGATELCLACDFRLMADGDSNVGLPEATVAILPGAGGTQRLTRLLGVGKALELMLDGALLSPTQAQEYGLINRVVSEEDLFKEALVLARRMARRPPVSIGGIKQAVRIGGSRSFMGGLETEKRYFYNTGYTKDAVRAFEYYFKESEQGKSDREIIKDLQSGKPIDFNGC